MSEITQKMLDDLRAAHGNDLGYKSHDATRELAQTMEQYAKLQLAYASACQDVVALREENARLKAETTQLRNENLTLHARMGQIVDTATMPMPEYWHPRIG